MTSCTKLSCDDNLSVLATMCKQEKKYYPDTLPYPSNISFPGCLNHNEKDNDHDYDDIDIDDMVLKFDISHCRLKMIQWCYQIMHYYYYDYNNSNDSSSRIYVEMTMSYMDRFLLTKMGHHIIVNSDRYQLATVTALYIVLKIHSPTCDSWDIVDNNNNNNNNNNSWQKCTPEMVSTFFTQNVYNPKEIVIMEQNILFALDWYLNPHTTDQFLFLFIQQMENSLLLLLFLNPDITSAYHRNTHNSLLSLSTVIKHLCQIQIEIALVSGLMDGQHSRPSASSSSTTTSSLQGFTLIEKVGTYKASMIAYTAFINTLEHMHVFDYYPKNNHDDISKTFHQMKHQLAIAIGITTNEEWKLVTELQYQINTIICMEEEEEERRNSHRDHCCFVQQNHPQRTANVPIRSEASLSESIFQCHNHSLIQSFFLSSNSSSSSSSNSCFAIPMQIIKNLMMDHHDDDSKREKNSLNQFDFYNNNNTVQCVTPTKYINNHTECYDSPDSVHFSNRVIKRTDCDMNPNCSKQITNISNSSSRSRSVYNNGNIHYERCKSGCCFNSTSWWNFFLRNNEH